MSKKTAKRMLGFLRFSRLLSFALSETCGLVSEITRVLKFSSLSDDSISECVTNLSTMAETILFIFSMFHYVRHLIG